MIGVQGADDYHCWAAVGQLDGGIQQVFGGLGVLESIENQRLVTQVNQPGVRKTRPILRGDRSINAFGQCVQDEMSRLERCIHLGLLLVG